jgi:hypothetical protein
VVLESAGRRQNKNVTDVLAAKQKRRQEALLTNQHTIFYSIRSIAKVNAHFAPLARLCTAWSELTYLNSKQLLTILVD